VTAVAFRPDSVELLQRMGLRAVRADVRDRGSLYAPLDGADLVINATVSVPCDPARVRFCGEVAEAGLGHVAEVVRQLGVPRLVSCSLLRSAAPSDGSFFDEESVPLTAGEEKARAALDKSGDTRQVVVRLGEVYSGDGQAWQILAQALHEAKAPILGDGNGMRQVIHSDDAAAALVALATDMLGTMSLLLFASSYLGRERVSGDGGQQLQGASSVRRSGRQQRGHTAHSGGGHRGAGPAAAAAVPGAHGRSADRGDHCCGQLLGGHRLRPAAAAAARVAAPRALL
jgi:hypothetical protein